MEKTAKHKIILFVTSESGPYRASGGLADVAEALPVAFKKKNVHMVRVMPKYKGIEEKYELKKLHEFIVEITNRPMVAAVYEHELDGIKTYFIGNAPFFERDNLYGYEDDSLRFGFFCKAVIEMLISIGLKPDIIHANDWQTALIGLFLKQEYSSLDFYRNMKMVFTIHNLQYQGVFERDVLKKLNISEKYFNSEAVEYYGKICMMKAGIVYSNAVTTVSQKYAREIQTPEFGYGLDGLLRKYSNKIHGIINGIYYDKYNPEDDAALKYPFTVKNYKKERERQKAAFRKEIGLAESNQPLMGVVTRLAEQKGIDLILAAIKKLAKEDIQFVILGSGEKYYEAALKEMEKQYPHQVAVITEFNPAVARQIYGSVDMFLMPSLFEPCGLSQMYSLRYGAVPIVRNTGGLSDTIIGYEEDPKTATGFRFNNYFSNDFIEAIRRAMECFKDKKVWNEIIQRGMETRFSWDGSAEEYLALYRDILENKNN
ncbi:glycogen synthase [Clostridiales bacterium COT073_COT-073]|nr:glycogen synthase [Clostridiales bacterium COT073_COT-073]